MLIRRCPILSL